MPKASLRKNHVGMKNGVRSRHKNRVGMPACPSTLVKRAGSFQPARTCPTVHIGRSGGRATARCKQVRSGGNFTFIRFKPDSIKLVGMALVLAIAQFREKRTNTVKELLRLFQPGKVSGVLYDQ